MRTLTVAAAVLNQTPLDWTGNTSRVRKAIEDARVAGASVLCLPEMCITGYNCEDAFLSAGVVDRAWDTLQALLAATRGMIVSFGLPVLHHNGLYNAVALVCDGTLVALVPKRHLAGDGLHYEPRWFNPWPQGEVAVWRRGDVEVPIGDLIVDCGELRIGFEVCEDAWVAERPGGEQSRLGVDLIMNPSASHFAFGKRAVREGFVVDGSRAFGVTYLYANLLGNEAGRAIYDGGAMIAANGRLLAIGPRFSFEAVVVTAVTVDVDATRMGRARTHSYVPDVTEPPGRIVRAPWTWPEGAGVPTPPLPPETGWEADRAAHKEQEFTRAIALALFDYLRKSRSRGFVVSLSGGADSAACVCLVRLAIDLALAELGRDGLGERLAYMESRIAGADSAAELTTRLLTTAYQATRNSGEVTRSAAADVAGAVGAVHHELDVDALVVGYRAVVERALGRELTWATDDITLQNIQARARGPSVWMLANIANALLLATSNRSEAAVGYATMDGDTCGGLSPIAGIDKAFLRQWLRWLEKTGPVETGPVPALAAVNVQQPTAELRPAEMEQTDEGDLMPYPVLDAIEKAAIRDKRMPLEVWELMQVQFASVTPTQMAAWVERFFQLWCRNQWKRERYAPSFHVDDENLDPKTWCRFPILSGGFEVELAELRAVVQSLAVGAKA